MEKNENDNDDNDNQAAVARPKRKYSKRLPLERDEPRRLWSRVIDPVKNPAPVPLQEGKEDDGDAGKDVVALLNCLSQIISRGKKV